MLRLRWILLIVLVVAALLLVWQWRGPSIPDGAFLVLEVEGEYVEAQDASWVSRLIGGRARPFTGLIAELYKAERDERVAGVALRIRGLDVGWAKAQEIRAALGRLRDAGKRTVAHLELQKYGANREYYVASAADAIYTAPGARTPFVGLAAEYLFLGGLFEKIGVEYEYERIGKYKSAVESFAARGMSEPSREMSESLLDDVAARFIGDVAEARGLAPERVHEIVDLAPTTPEQLLELGLIDGVSFFDEALAAEGDPPVVRSEVYARVPADRVGHRPEATFALIYATGSVVSGKGGVTPRGQRVAASETLAEAFEDAADDPDVRAIIFRIDSPGGSALASDLIWRATQRARQRGKPVVASLSDVAASGGYYVAAGADKIVALPSTLTGSIGVYVLRPAIGGLLEKLGVGVTSLTRGAHADLLLASRGLSPGARALIRQDVRGVYDLFVARVAEGREMEPSAVDAVGRGRVFTGAQARDAGLVDVLGGLREAVREAKLLVGLDPEADVVLSVFPAPKPLLEQLNEALGVSIAERTRLFEVPLPQGLRAALEALTTLPAGAPVLIPPLIPEIH